MLFTVTQFHISNTSNGGVSVEVCKFLEECYCWVATSEIDGNISWKCCIILKCVMYILMDSFLLFTSILLKMLEFHSLCYKKKRYVKKQFDFSFVNL